MRSIVVSPTSTNAVRVSLYEVQNLDVGQPPEGSFVVTLPTGTVVSDPTDMRSFIKLRSAEQIGRRNLSELYSRCQSALEQRVIAKATRRSPKAARQQERSSWRMQIVAANVIAIAAVAIFFVWRARSRANR